MYNLLKKYLFSLDAETAHYRTMGWYEMANKIPLLRNLLNAPFHQSDAGLEKSAMGIAFKNPVGLAAGFDKDARFISLMENLGFGFIEIGTLTPRPQVGNPKPRLFRLPKDEALINRMGFNNEGVDAAVKRLQNRNSETVIGGNIGKNKDTPNSEAHKDYLYCFEQLHPWVDYFVLNVSSPNTPGLRELQEKEPLLRIIGSIQNRNVAYERRKPILLKIAPDINDAILEDILEVIHQMDMDGIVATNTTVDRSKLTSNPEEVQRMGAGGLSGKPLVDIATDLVSDLRNSLGSDKCIIGVGGIHNVDAAVQKLKAGADLIQIYTGLIYQGPSFIRDIKKELQRMASDESVV